jgi:hypothetical protein
MVGEFAGVNSDVIARLCRLYLDRCQHRRLQRNLRARFVGVRAIFRLGEFAGANS